MIAFPANVHTFENNRPQRWQLYLAIRVTQFGNAACVGDEFNEAS